MPAEIVSVAALSWLSSSVPFPLFVIGVRGALEIRQAKYRARGGVECRRARDDGGRCDQVRTGGDVYARAVARQIVNNRSPPIVRVLAVLKLIVPTR